MDIAPEATWSGADTVIVNGLPENGRVQLVTIWVLVSCAAAVEEKVAATVTASVATVSLTRIGSLPGRRLSEVVSPMTDGINDFETSVFLFRPASGIFVDSHVLGRWTAFDTIG